MPSALDAWDAVGLAVALRLLPLVVLWRPPTAAGNPARHVDGPAAEIQRLGPHIQRKRPRWCRSRPVRSVFRQGVGLPYWGTRITWKPRRA